MKKIIFIIYATVISATFLCALMIKEHLNIVIDSLIPAGVCVLQLYFGWILVKGYAYISGGKYDLDIRYNKNYIYKTNGNTYFAATVPEGTLFVMGDNRNGSSDSRTSRIGFVDVDTVLGKAILRLSPFTILD